MLIVIIFIVKFINLANEVGLPEAYMVVGPSIEPADAVPSCRTVGDDAPNDPKHLYGAWGYGVEP